MAPPDRKRKHREVVAVTGKDILDTIVKKMKVVGDGGVLPEVASPPVRCRRCPLRWCGVVQKEGPIRDLKEYLLKDHKFVARRKLPIKKHFCTSSGFEGAREWGHLVDIHGHTLAYVIGYNPHVSKTHCFVSVFTLHPQQRQQPRPGQPRTEGERAPLGPVTVIIRPSVTKDSGGVREARFTWTDVPHGGTATAPADLEPLCGLFPMKLFSSRLAEGLPHERAIELSIEAPGPMPPA